MSQLYILYEHASGYTLFRTTEFEEITMLLPQVEESVGDFSKFRSVVQLVAFKPFSSAENALENINSLSEGILHPDLELFLETNVPKSKKKKQRVILGVAEPKLGAAIVETLKFSCLHTGVVPEIIRGIRCYVNSYVSGLTSTMSGKAELGLGHSYSRAKVKFNVNRVDNMIIQTISILDQLDKNINSFAMHIREWYSYHFPELFKIVPDNTLYARVVSIVKDRANIDENVVEQLEEVLDSEKVQNILSVARSSMGMDIAPVDLHNIQMFCGIVVSQANFRSRLHEYLKSRMNNVAPNLSTLIGEVVGARLISHAGSLTSLAKYPASTLQILGAEKALFRALKTRSKTPKYGLIFHSTFIGRAAKQNKGRISRFLANKCSMASRIDSFSEIPTSVFGQHLRQQVEDRLKFYDSGVTPKKNIDVMNLAASEAEVVREELLKKKRKREKKEKKKKQAELSAIAQLSQDYSLEIPEVSKESCEDGMVEDQGENHIVLKKKKKKRAKLDNEEEPVPMDEEVPENGPIENEHTPKKKKKKKEKELNYSM